MKHIVEKIDYDLDSYTDNSYATHNFHPYPAKFIPQIPLEIIDKLTKKNDWILDPFCGCGTTLVEAKLHGRNSIGVDLNPLSTLISKVKTTPLSDMQIGEVSDIAESICHEIKIGNRYEIPDLYNIDHWFQKDIKEALSVIRHFIRNCDDRIVGDFLSVAFSSIIVRVSNQDSDTRYVAVKKNVTKDSVIRIFSEKIADMISRVKVLTNQIEIPETIVFTRDSTTLDYVKHKIDLAITSPPYMNSYDYYLYHKHRLGWLGFDHKEVQEKEIGSRNKHNDHGLGLPDYTKPILENAQAVRRTLKIGGYYCVVVGDSVLRKEIYRMNAIYDQIFSDARYEKVREIKFDQRKYTRSFTSNMKTQQKDSYILFYRKDSD